MMKTIPIYLILLFSFLFFSCEDVIDVDLETQDPKLVVEANLIQIEDQYNNHYVRLTTTAGFYDSTVPTVDHAEILIKNITHGTKHPFYKQEEPGFYWGDNFSLSIGDTYQLNITIDDHLYQATETVLETPEIIKMEQLPFNSPFFDHTIEIKAHFKDPSNEKNFYLVQWFKNGERFDFGIYSDEFYTEDMTFSRYMRLGTEEDDFYQVGDSITASLTSLSSTMYDYLYKLIEVSTSRGNPFASPMGPVRGNIKNMTNPADYPLGYFAVLTTKTKTLTIE